MPEIVENIKFTFKEVVTALVKAHDIHEGIWALSVRFGLQAMNLGSGDNDFRPSAVIPIVEMQIQKVEKETNLAVDAALVNPRAKTPPVRHPQR